MELLEIMVGKYMQDMLVSGTGQVMYANCYFSLTEDRWMKIENSNRYNVHILLPKRKEDDSRICYHIASKETIWVPIDYWTDVDWNETTLISSEGNIPICINKVNDNEEKGTIWKMDFFEFSMKQEEFKLVVPSCDAKKIIYQCFLSSVEDAYTQYIGDMTIADNERILPWKSTIFSTVVEFDYKTIVVLKENEEGEECDMGLISTLLTGGILIGKVCQVIAGGISSLVTDEETGTRLSENYVSFDDMRIGMYSSPESSELKLYAFNCSNVEKTVQFPVDDNGNSLLYSIPATCKQELSSQLSNCKSPDGMLQLATVGNTSNAGDGVVSAKIHIENLIVGNLGSSINVYGYNISADTDGLLISGAASADMTYCELTAKSGIKITVMQDISPVAGDTQKNKYNLNFKDYGITQDDVLSGMIQFNTSTTTWKELCEKQQSKLDSEGAIPFSDADQRLLRRVGALK